MKNRKNILNYIVAAIANHHVPVILTAFILFVFTTSDRSSAAARAKTYHGTLTGGTFFCGGNPVPGPAVSGNWNVNIDPATPAQVTINVFYDGGHHLSFGYNALMLVSSSGGVYVFSGFGDSATATLDTTTAPATFSWHVELGGGCPPEGPYDSLTYFGVANRGRR
jgi:hypothetical protein